MARSRREAIAIVGLGCRFPGGGGPAAFWRLIRDGRDAISEVPAERWDCTHLYDPDPSTPGKMSTRWGGFVDEIDRFDARFFGVAPREAPFIDPQQRLLLEVAWEALEDAGLAVDRLAGSRTGVFIGIGSHDYSLLGWSELSTISAYTGPGTSASIAANRISYLFDFHGPSIAVDTACSASLVAAHLACQSLWAGESTIALVGGVNALLLPVGTIGLSKAGAMARDGRCKVFDARADGYVRSEGAGVVVLKPLSRALADRDAIYGSILGTAVNANGRTNGLMAPNGRAQEAVIREAWQQANVSPGLADYVEAHGTGTQLGDPIEAKALGAVFGSTRESGRTCVLGSVKANVGHLEAAAGIAGLIKVALMLRHGAIPPSLHFKTPNPHIPFERLPLRVTERLEPWADSGRRLAGVSSSGFGGANAHLVVEGPPRAAARSMTESPNPDAANVLPISARSETALRTLVERYVEALGRAFDQRASVQRICHTAAVRRTHHLEQRVAFVGRTAEELRRELSGWVDGSQEGSLRSSTHTPSRGGRELVFIFSGHGSQWSGMGRALMREEPAFRAAVNQCETAFAPYVDWSLRDVLDANAACARQPSIDVVQPALFAVQIALAALWRSWGIEPAAVVGHSMGEVAAAQVAGILSLDDAARIICRRSALLERKSGKGAMAATELALAEAEAAVAPYHGRLSIAASNGPRSTVLSGDEGALADVMERLGREGVFARRVQVDVASHSAHMDDLANELMAALEGLRPGSAHVPFYSTVTGGREDGNGCGPCYWVDNLRRPVLFSSAIEHTLGDGHHAFLELSPHPLLLPAVEDVCRHATRTALVIGSLRRDEDPRTSLLRSLSALYVNGSRVDWAALFGEPMEPVPLPSYPWDRERFWLDTSPRIPERRPAASAEGNHPLLQPRVDPAFQPDRSCWHVDVAGERAAYLADHQLRGKAVMPAAAYIEMALAATTDQRVFEPLHVRDLRLEQVLSIDAASSPEVQVTRSRDAHDSVLVQVFSRARSADSHWNEHVRVIVARQTEPAHSRPRLDIDSVRSRCPEHRPAERFYTDLAACGLHYGPRFRAVLDTWRGDAEAVLEVALPDDALDPDTYIAHPVLVDAACFQAVAAVLPRLEDVSPLDTFLPVRVESLEVLQRLPSRLWAHITARGTLESDMIGCDVTMTDADGYVVMRASGIEVRRIAGLPDSARRAWEDCLYEVRWERSFRVAATSVRQTNSRWLICGDRGAVGERLGAALEALGESAAHVAYGAAYQSGPARRYCINPDRPEDFRRLLEEAFDDGASCSGIVFLWSLDGPDARNVSVERLRDAERIGTRAALHLVQALLRVAWRQQPRTWIVTRAAQRVDARDRDPSVAHSTLWGFGRVVRHEHPELQCTLIDVAAELSEDPAGQLAGELVNGDAEVEIALRSGDRFVARLARYEGGARSTARSAAPPFALSIASPGNLQTLRLESCARRPPRPGEVEVEVHAAGLNFLDVLVAMGVQPNRDARARLHGLELSGTVSRVGPRVTTLEPGDEVVGFAEDVFGSFALASEAWLVRKPANLSFGAAATLP
ncbi:MAG TPA: beta-ketoacyl synthase N-terminal-like domain-containing protein, partial [Vicinamibacterales bacterium]